MEHVFSMLFARGFILQEKKFCTKKKLFTTRTFLTALCRRPYPARLVECQWPWRRMPAGRAATGRRAHAASWRQHGHAGPAGGHWVIWVIWVTVLNCMAMHAIGSFGSHKKQ
jgi:hypothetical protein